MTTKKPRAISRGLSRRRFLSTAAATGAGAFGVMAMPYLSRAADRPQITHGVHPAMSGADAAWCGARADRPFANDGRGRHVRVVSQCAGVAADRSAPRERLFYRQNAAGKNLPAGQDIFYRVGSATCRTPTFSSERSSAASAPRRPTGACQLRLAVTSPDKAGASIPTTAACSFHPCRSASRFTSASGQ